MLKSLSFGTIYSRCYHSNCAEYSNTVRNNRTVQIAIRKRMCCNLPQAKAHMREIFEKAVDSVRPHNVIKGNLKLNGDKLHVRNKTYFVKHNCYVVGFGKAVLGMATETENILGDHLISGVVSVPIGILDTFKNMPHMIPSKTTKLQVLEGAENNLPDEKSLEAAKKIEALVRSLNENALLIVLISGGGSALLPAPVPPVTLNEKCETINLLSSAGADIMKLNCIRKRLSYLKGGGLARLAYPAQVIALILSDVVGDSVSYIASGPTAVNNDKQDDALNIIKKYNLLDKIPPSVSTTLRNKQSDVVDSLSHTHNLIIGNNSIALCSAAVEASKCGYHPIILTRNISHQVPEVSKAYILLATNICKYLSGQLSEKKLLNTFDSAAYTIPLDIDFKEKLLQGIYCFNDKKGLCLLAGGETTVLVKGTGKGGRNQELALSFSAGIQEACRKNFILHKYNIVLLSAGTDGIDGPTGAAGAIGYRQQAEAAQKCNLNIEQYLENNDSHNFYKKLGIADDLIVIGHTGTNVMDMHIIIIQAVLESN